MLLPAIATLAILALVVSGLSIHHDNLNSEMEYVSSGYNNYDISGKAVDQSDKTSYNLSGDLQNMMRFVVDDRIYSMLEIHPSIKNLGSDNTAYIGSWYIELWLDAKKMCPIGSVQLQSETIKVSVEDDYVDILCDVYTYTESEYKLKYYVNSDVGIIYRIAIDDINLAVNMIYSNQYSEKMILNASMVSDMVSCNIIKGTYVSGPIGETKEIDVTGKERYIEYTYPQEMVTKNYAAIIKTTVVSNNESRLSNIYLQNTVYMKLELYVSGESDAYITCYIPCSDTDHIGQYRSEYELPNGEKYMGTYLYFSKGYLDSNILHSESYQIYIAYDENYNELKGIKITGTKYEDSYGSEDVDNTVNFSFETKGWEYDW